MGLQGPQGSQGSQGPAGAKGEQGNDGISGDDVSFISQVIGIFQKRNNYDEAFITLYFIEQT